VFENSGKIVGESGKADSAFCFSKDDIEVEVGHDQ
jgi:hypothetical protein